MFAVWLGGVPVGEQHGALPDEIQAALQTLHPLVDYLKLLLEQSAQILHPLEHVHHNHGWVLV